MDCEGYMTPHSPYYAQLYVLVPFEIYVLYLLICSKDHWKLHGLNVQGSQDVMFP